MFYLFLFVLFLVFNVICVILLLIFHLKNIVLHFVLLGGVFGLVVSQNIGDAVQDRGSLRLKNILSNINAWHLSK